MVTDEALPKGFVIPTHRGVTVDVTIAGLPRGYAILNGTMALVIGMGLPNPLIGGALGFGQGFVGYLIGRWLTAHDARFFKKMAVRRPSYLRPW